MLIQKLQAVALFARIVAGGELCDGCRQKQEVEGSTVVTVLPE